MMRFQQVQSASQKKNCTYSQEYWRFVRFKMSRTVTRVLRTFYKREKIFFFKFYAYTHIGHMVGRLLVVRWSLVNGNDDGSSMLNNLCGLISTPWQSLTIRSGTESASDVAGYCVSTWFSIRFTRNSISSDLFSISVMQHSTLSSVGRFFMNNRSLHDVSIFNFRNTPQIRSQNSACMSFRVTISFRVDSMFRLFAYMVSRQVFSWWSWSSSLMRLADT